MNKLLSNLANNEKLSTAVMLTGLGLSIAGNALMYIGVYYLALRKGVEIRDNFYYEEEVKKYEEGR